VGHPSSNDDEKRIVTPDKRLTALRAALREARQASSSTPDAVPDSGADPARRRAFARERTRGEAIEFVQDIALTGTLIQNALDYDRCPIAPANAEHALLGVIERTEGSLAFSDLARALHISRQRAREIAIAAARRGTVELSPALYDRRLILVSLTVRGKQSLSLVRQRESGWVARLLNGLHPREMRAVAHVLQVIRRRLRRDEQERLEAAKARSSAPRHTDSRHSPSR
jgi:DNA-binding MarR family transcriptional regulator